MLAIAAARLYVEQRERMKNLNSSLYLLLPLFGPPAHVVKKQNTQEDFQRECQQIRKGMDAVGDNDDITETRAHAQADSQRLTMQMYDPVSQIVRLNLGWWGPPLPETPVLRFTPADTAFFVNLLGLTKRDTRRRRRKDEKTREERDTRQQTVSTHYL